MYCVFIAVLLLCALLIMRANTHSMVLAILATCVVYYTSRKSRRKSAVYTYRGGHVSLVSATGGASTGELISDKKYAQLQTELPNTVYDETGGKYTRAGNAETYKPEPKTVDTAEPKPAAGTLTDEQKRRLANIRIANAADSTNTAHNTLVRMLLDCEYLNNAILNPKTSEAAVDKPPAKPSESADAKSPTNSGEPAAAKSRAAEYMTKYKKILEQCTESKYSQITLTDNLTEDIPPNIDTYITTVFAQKSPWFAYNSEATDNRCAFNGNTPYRIARPFITDGTNPDHTATDVRVYVPADMLKTYTMVGYIATDVSPTNPPRYIYARIQTGKTGTPDPHDRYTVFDGTDIQFPHSIEYMRTRYSVPCAILYKRESGDTQPPHNTDGIFTK